VHGVGRFVSANVLEVMGASGSQRIRFDQCIIAAGSEAVRLPGLPQDPRILDSATPSSCRSSRAGCWWWVGGIIGLEMACVFDALGRRVSVVELTAQLMPGCDPDLVRPLERRIRARYQQILLDTRLAGIEPEAAGLRVSFAGDKAPPAQTFERVLVAVGRVPNGKTLSAELGGRDGLGTRLHSRRPADAHQRAAHLRDRRHRCAAAAGPQGHARGQGGRGSRRRSQARGRLARDSFSGLHRSGDCLGGAHRKRRARPTAPPSGRAHSPGWRTAAHSRSAARRVSPSCCSILTRTACWVAASSAPTPAS